MRKRDLFCLTVLGAMAASGSFARAEDDADTRARCMAAAETGRKLVLYANRRRPGQRDAGILGP